MDWGTIAWSCLGIGVGFAEVTAADSRPNRPVSKLESNKPEVLKAAVLAAKNSAAGHAKGLPALPALKAYEVDMLQGLYEVRAAYLLDAPSATHFILSRPGCPLFPEGWSVAGTHDLVADFHRLSLSDRYDWQLSPTPLKSMPPTMTR